MYRFAWISTLILVTAATAQQPTLNPQGQKPAIAPPLTVPNQPAAPAAPANPRLDALLADWEKSMKGVESLMAAVTLSEVDALTKTTEVYEGQVKFMRPNMADLYVAKKSNPQQYKRYLCTGNYLYDFSPREKRIRAYPLPPRAAGQPIADNTFIGFLAGMSAVEAKRRFQLSMLVSPQNPTGEDNYYAYIKVEPRFGEDKAEFSVARLAILKSTMMPAEMRFITPTGDEVRWTISSIQTNAASRVARTDFGPPQKPNGWTMDNMPPPGPPTGAPPAGPAPSKVRPKGQ
ncbi:MAG TPA: TIGR03009 domain-containing protein [Pirellulales bacterium]|jgi:TIGR03009 family protein